MARNDSTKRRQKLLKLPHTHRFTEQPYGRYAIIIGQANLAWNDLHIKLISVFQLVCSLSFPGSKEKNYLHLKSHYIWNSSQSDRRREFIVLVGASVVWPVTARAQQTIPVVGFVFSGTASSAAAPYVTAFKLGLEVVGFIEGQNVAVEYHWPGGHDAASIPAAS